MMHLERQIAMSTASGMVSGSHCNRAASGSRNVMCVCVRSEGGHAEEGGGRSVKKQSLVASLVAMLPSLHLQQQHITGGEHTALNRLM